MKIGELAERSGLSRDGIRFYEREGLLPSPRRGPSGYREYADDAVSRLDGIRRARELGFTLPEILELLALADDAQADAAAVHERALSKLADLDRRIGALQEMRSRLASLAEACGGEGTRACCPILGSLSL